MAESIYSASSASASSAEEKRASLNLVTSDTTPPSRPSEKDQSRPKVKRFGQLEALRGIAALYVVAHHIWIQFSPNVQTDPLRVVLKHGMLAVMVFFVLSGFVIEYSSTTKGTINNFPLYFRKRFARIYPLFLIALLVSYLVKSAREGHLAALHLRDLLGNVVMLQGSEVDTGRWFLSYGGDAPLWSLTYEWWFYMMYFPVRKLLPERFQALFVAGLSALGLVTDYLVKPNQISMVLTLFIIWWLGVEIARGHMRDGYTSMRHVKVPLLASFALTAGLFIPLVVGGHSLRDLAHFQLTSFVYMFLVVAVGLAWQRIHFAGFNRLFSYFGLLAPISYSIYIFHMPVVTDSATLFPQWPAALVDAALLVVLGVFCYLLEVPFQRRITRLLVPASKSRSRPD